jgi:hypothetical protein
MESAKNDLAALLVPIIQQGHAAGKAPSRIGLPRMSSYAEAWRLRQQPGHESVRLVALAGPHPGKRRLHLAAGATIAGR